MAVLGAAAGLDRDDPLDLHLGPAPAHPHLMRQLQRVVDQIVRKPQHLQRLRLVEADAPLEDLLTGDVEDHAGISSLRSCPPSGSLPSSGAIAARSSRLQVAARSGSRGHEPITMPRQLSPRRSIASTVSAVWLSVPRPGAGDDDQRRVEQFGDVGDRPAVAEAHEQPAGALDDHVLVLERFDEAGDLARRDAGDAGAGGGGRGRQRLGVVRERERRRPRALADRRGIVVVARLRGLDVGALGRAQGGGDVGLADTGVGAGHDDAHATIASVIRSRSASSVMYGGIA